MPKQDRLIEEGLIPEIVEAADKLEELQTKRMRLQEQERDQREIVKAVLKKHGYEDYPYEGKHAFIEKGEEKARVQKLKTTKKSESEEVEV